MPNIYHKIINENEVKQIDNSIQSYTLDQYRDRSFTSEAHFRLECEASQISCIPAVFADYDSKNIKLILYCSSNQIPLVSPYCHEIRYYKINEEKQYKGSANIFPEEIIKLKIFPFVEINDFHIKYWKTRDFIFYTTQNQYDMYLKFKQKNELQNKIHIEIKHPICYEDRYNNFIPGFLFFNGRWEDEYELNRNIFNGCYMFDKKYKNILIGHDKKYQNDIVENYEDSLTAITILSSINDNVKYIATSGAASWLYIMPINCILLEHCFFKQNFYKLNELRTWKPNSNLNTIYICTSIDNLETIKNKYDRNYFFTLLENNK